MIGKNIAPVFCLLLLAPWIGEFLLGSSPLRNLPYIWLLIPIYGGGALLIREVTKQLHLESISMLCFAVAYSIIQAGLIDQSIFNDSYFGEESTHVPLENRIVTTLSYIAGHVIWSISIPIALTEMLFPTKTGAWMRKRGLVFTSILYIIGCVIVFSFTYDEHRFLAAPYQLAGCVMIALAAIMLGLKMKNVHFIAHPPNLAPTAPWKAGLCAFVFSSIFAARPENWAGTMLGIILMTTAFVVLHSWGKNDQWTIFHKFSVVAGTISTCAWTGFVVTLLLWPGDILAWIGNVIFTFMAIIFLIVAFRRISRLLLKI